ncbi:MAG: YceI family protein, partial [Anaerolineae bacterium]
MDFKDYLKQPLKNGAQPLMRAMVSVNKKLILAIMLMLITAFAFGCSQPVAPVEEPAAAVETSSEVEEVSTTDEESEVAEEVVAEEVMAEEVAAEEVMEEESMAEGVAGTYTVSTADSTVTWTGSKPVGNSHTGVVDITEGELTLADGALVSGSFMLDMTSIAATDGSPDRLIQHLNSDDFFGTATFPTASLVINSAESLGDGSYAVLGDLTIKEITNPIEFTATAAEEDGVVTASADIVFDRALYDVQFGSGSFFSDLGDDLISDEIEITVALVAMSGDHAMAEEVVADEAMEEESMAEGVAGTYTVSTADSTVTWTGSKPVGNSHTGVVDITEGELTLADGALVSGSFMLDMTSIAATDGSPDRLIQHLNSDDFFGTATFPTASLVINSAESLGDGSYAVLGDLTIKEISNPIEFTATAAEEDGVVTASADIVFDRALYDVQFGSGSF